MPERSAADLMAAIGERQRRLRELLSDDAPRYAERPPDGKWSVIENLCHLVFAQQAHLGRYLPSPPPWSPFALPPSGMQTQARFRQLGEVPSSAGEVLDAWAAIHEAMGPLATNDDPRFLNRLERHVKHLNAHVKVIERLLRAQEKATS